MHGIATNISLARQIHIHHYKGRQPFRSLCLTLLSTGMILLSTDTTIQHIHMTEQSSSAQHQTPQPIIQQPINHITITLTPHEASKTRNGVDAMLMTDPLVQAVLIF